MSGLPPQWNAFVDGLGMTGVVRLNCAGDTDVHVHISLLRLASKVIADSPDFNNNVVMVVDDDPIDWVHVLRVLYPNVQVCVDAKGELHTVLIDYGWIENVYVWVADRHRLEQHRGRLQVGQEVRHDCTARSGAFFPEVCRVLHRRRDKRAVCVAVVGGLS
jgi:hypothetical protein